MRYDTMREILEEALTAKSAIDDILRFIDKEMMWSETQEEDKK